MRDRAQLVDTASPTRPPLWLVVGMASVGPFSVSLYLPALPALAAGLDASTAQVQLTLTLYLIGFALAQLIYGPLSDRLGRRPTLLVGLTLYVIASGVAVCATTLPMLLAARLVQALGACAGAVVGRAVLRDSGTGDDLQRAFALVAAALALSPAFGPAIGGFVTAWLGWRGCFMVLTAFGALLLACALVGLPETNRHPSTAPLAPARLAREYRALLRDRVFLGFALTAACVYGAVFVYNVGAPFIFIRLLDFTPESYGLLGLITAPPYLLGTMIVRRRAATPPARLALEGALCALVGAIAMLIVGTVGPLSAVAIIAAAMIFSVGLGMVLPACATGALARYPRSAGSASAVIGCTQMIVGVAATAALAATDPTTAAAMAGLFAFLTLVGVAFCRLTRSPREI